MKQIWPILALVVLVAILTREFFPKNIKGPPPIPTIVTKYDTVHDVVEVAGPEVVTTDTVQIVIRQTIHDTTFINVGCEPAERTNIWPVVGLEVGPRRGDTTVVQTFSLRTGQGAASRLYTPGPLLGVWADSTPTPRFLFGQPPDPVRVSFWTKAKWGGIGYGACTIIRSLAELIRGH